MKKQKMKNFFKFKILIGLLLLSFTSAYAVDMLSTSLSVQTSSGVGSSGSEISLTSKSGSDSWAEYWNTGENSTIIGNIFKGFYYDSIFGYFQLDHGFGSSEDKVHVSSPTAACSTGYGYKIGGYAYSSYYGFIDFDYNNNTFVYYCVDDQSLHGYAYNENIGYQNFEGIGFDIVPNIITNAVKTSTGVFVNDTTSIDQPNFWDGNINTYIGGDVINLDDDKESIFYIIK